MSDLPLADVAETWPVERSEDLHRDHWVVALRADHLRIPPPGPSTGSGTEAGPSTGSGTEAGPSTGSGTEAGPSTGSGTGAGETFRRLVVENPGAVMVLAVDDEDRVVVLRQYRHPVEHRVVQLPAGLLDVAGEDPVEAARRELVEEAGVEAEHWRHLVTTWPSPGISAETHSVYLATALRGVGRRGFVPHAEEADMSVERVPFEDLLAGVLGGGLHDGPMALALTTYAVLRARDTE